MYVRVQIQKQIWDTPAYSVLPDKMNPEELTKRDAGMRENVDWTWKEVVAHRFREAERASKLKWNE